MNLSKDNFKLGDYVYYIGCGNKYVYGKRYTITEITKYYCFLDNNPYWIFNYEHFLLTIKEMRKNKIDSL